jgi:2-polyprenyl-3-methyl-5-hydroxy-6-metoxy-1,4-benzoquinol methylase
MDDPQSVRANHACHDFNVGGDTRRFNTQERFWGIGGEFQYVECPACKSWSLYPAPTDEQLTIHYSGYYPSEELEHRQRRPVSALEQARARQTYRVLKELRDFKPKDRVLDVGTGCGGFLAALRAEVDVTVFGCDQNAGSAQIAQTLFNIHIDIGQFSDLSYPRKSFDLITLWHCFEHVRLPEETLTQLHDLLNSEGVLVMEIPTPGFWARVFKGAWLFLQAPTHLNLFTPEALIEKLNRTGFEIVKVQRPWSPSEWAGSILLKLGLTGFMPRVYFGPTQFSDRLWRTLFFALLPLDLCLTLVVALCGQSGLLRVYAKPKQP